MAVTCPRNFPQFNVEVCQPLKEQNKCDRADYRAQIIGMKKFFSKRKKKQTKNRKLDATAEVCRRHVLKPGVGFYKLKAKYGRLRSRQGIAGQCPESEPCQHPPA